MLLGKMAMGVKQRKEELKKKNLLVAGGSELLQVDLSQLQNPSGMENDVYIGRGSFGVIRLQVFRGIYVAVKELLPHSLLVDVKSEASLLFLLCHPYLPFFFGIHTTSTPYKIIMQFHSLVNDYSSVTLYGALSKTLVHQAGSFLLLNCLKPFGIYTMK